MYCFILLFNLLSSSTTDFTVTGSGTLILCNVQLTVLEIFHNLGYIYDALQHNIWLLYVFVYVYVSFSVLWAQLPELNDMNKLKNAKIRFFKSKKSYLNQKIWFKSKNPIF